MFDKSVSEWILSDRSWSFGIFLLPQQEVNHLLQQSLWCHLSDDPVQQGCGGQDAHLGPMCPHKHTTCYRAVTTHDTLTRLRISIQDDWLMTYVCISCGSITATKNLSLTAFAITSAADWKTEKKNTKFSSVVCGFQIQKHLLWKEVLLFSQFWLQYDAAQHQSQHWLRTLWASFMSWSQ